MPLNTSLWRTQSTCMGIRATINTLLLQMVQSPNQHTGNYVGFHREVLYFPHLVYEELIRICFSEGHISLPNVLLS